MATFFRRIKVQNACERNIFMCAFFHPIFWKEKKKKEALFTFARYRDVLFAVG